MLCFSAPVCSTSEGACGSVVACVDEEDEDEDEDEEADEEEEAEDFTTSGMVSMC